MPTGRMIPVPALGFWRPSGELIALLCRSSFLRFAIPCLLRSANVDYVLCRFSRCISVGCLIRSLKILVSTFYFFILHQIFYALVGLGRLICIT